MEHPCNIAARLEARAREHPERPAVICYRGRRTRQLTFAQLQDRVERLAAGLEAAGLRRGMRTILMVRPSPELFVCTFALLRAGAVPVLIDPGLGRRRMVDCLARVQAEAFIGIPLAHLLRVTHREAFRTLRLLVTVGVRLGWGGVTLRQLLRRAGSSHALAPTTTADTAAILFTSGSTGPPRGVLYRHGTFDAQVRLLAEAFGFAPGERDLATFPLFALFDVALGVTSVIPDMDATRPGSVRPERILEPLREQEATSMFGSPALLEQVGRHAAPMGLRLPTLRRVISAGAPVHRRILETFASLLEGDAQVYTPYGATEALPVTLIGSRELLSEEIQARSLSGDGVCVGRPVPGMIVRVMTIEEGPVTSIDELPTGEVGEVVVQGPVVTHAYLDDPEGTSLAKIQEQDRLWHRMGDLGRLDGQGRLWFCGRKVHRLVTSRGLLCTVPCETIFNQHPAVRRSALVGVGSPPSQQPVLCVELLAGVSRPWGEIREELRRLGAAQACTAGISTFLRHDAFPVDIRHNAKIFREQLATWATAQLATAREGAR